MSLVEYPDSEDSNPSLSPQSKTRGTKRRHPGEDESSLPPLPDTFHDLYASTTRVSNQDDPTLHGGRQRVMPHVEGNWPTHMYIEWHPSTEQSNRLQDVVTEIISKSNSDDNVLHSLLKSDLGADLPLHVSLSRPISLLTEQRSLFVDAIHSGIKQSNIRPFETSVSAFDWVPNYETTRWFLVMRLHKPPDNNLNKLLTVSNQVAQSSGQPPLYAEPQPPPSNPQYSKRRKPPTDPPHQTSSTDFDVDLSSSFHVSIGWMLHPPSEAMIDGAKQCGYDFSGMKIWVQAVKVKIGNNITSICLPLRVEGSNRIIEH